MAKYNRKTKELKKYQFTPAELSDKAFRLYSDEDEVFFTDEDGNFYQADNSTASTAWYIGSLEDVEEYLMWALEEMEEKV